MRYLLWYLLAVNLAALLAMGLDKSFARRHRRRIPEHRLLALAVLGGSVGALAGMLLFRHKTLHKKFSVGLPAILIVQLLAAGCTAWRLCPGLKENLLQFLKG